MKHIGPISGVASSRNGLIATAGYDNRVVLWNAETGHAIARVWHDHLANQCAFSSDGSCLVSASSDYSARIWRVPQMSLIGVLAGHEDDVEMAAFSPCGERVATCSRDARVRVYSRSGTLQAVCTGHRADVISVAWSEDGTCLISSSDDGTVRQWDADTGACLKTLDLGGVETDTLAVVNGDLIYAGNDSGEVIALSTGELRRWQAHGAGVKRLTYSKESSLLVSLSYDRSMVIWRVEANGELSQLDRASLPSIVWPRSCDFADANRVIFGTFGSKYASYDRLTRTWCLDGVEPDISVNALTHYRGKIHTVGDAGEVFCEGQQLLGLGSLCNFLTPYSGGILSGGQLGQLFDVLKARSVHTHTSPINCCAVYEVDGKERAIFGAYDGQGLVFELPRGGPPIFSTAVRLHENAVKGVAVSAGQIFSVCATGAAATHCASSLKELYRIERAHTKISNGCAAAAAARFVSVGRDLMLRIWKDGVQEVAVLSPHKNSIKCVAVSRDGTLVASGSYGGSIAVYSLAEQRWVYFNRPTQAGISCIVAAEADNCFVAASYDGTLHAIDPCGAFK